ncbi:MAG TPA: ATP-binding cassette domain-containing protein, partial [Conexibacter sp.]|nr:ATP-binding cassette domain-containing protein [Conexibacter sp.]
MADRAEHPAVRLEGLTVSVRRGRETRLLVERVDLSVERGQVCGIVGETGAGKTLTARALLGLLAPGLRAEGTAWLGDREIDASTPAKQRRELLGRDMGIVTQNPAGMLDPVMKVGRQLVEGVVRRRLLSDAEAVARAREMLSFVGFKDSDGVWELYP